MNTRHSHPPLAHRLATLFGLLMLVLSLTPMGLETAFAQSNGLNPVGDVAQEESGYIEVHVSECPPGSTGSAADLKPTCHENGMADVSMTVVRPDGTTFPKVTERVNGVGPGIINTGDVPTGMYTFDLDLPETNSYVIGCEYAADTTPVPSTPTTPGAFQVTPPAGIDIVCDVYVIPAADNIPEEPTTLAALDLTVRTCERADFPSDDRSRAALETNCVDVPTGPITISLKEGAAVDGPVVTTAAVDANGGASFAELQPGTYRVFSDLDGTVWGEYLVCSLDGAEPYEKEFDADGGAVFTDIEQEQIACTWYAVDSSVPEAATEPPTAEAVETLPADTATEAAETPDETSNVQEIDDAGTTTSVTVTSLSCGDGYDVDGNGTDPATFAANCTEPVVDLTYSLRGSGGDQTATTGADGVASWVELPPGSFDVWSHIPMEAATEYYVCTFGEGGVAQPMILSDRGVLTLSDVQAGEVNCTNYVVNENLRGEETGASVEVHLAACPQEYAGDDFYGDCHSNGVADMDYTLTGPGGEQSGTTHILTTPGPGVVTFTELPAGDYTLAGGPPQDFVSVELYCSDPASNERIEATMEGGIAHFSVSEQQSVICDWYVIPDNAQGEPVLTPTPTPTEIDERGEIYVTMFECDPSLPTAGSTFGQLDDACTTPVNDVPVALRASGGVPLNATTGEAGDGAVRFQDLSNGDYVMTPTLANDYRTVAVYCDLDGGDVYQKAVTNGSTTFVNLEGELVSCSWFVQAPKPISTETPTPAPTSASNPTVVRPTAVPQGPTGSITIREMLCEGERTTIKDWERECEPGSSGTAFTVTSTSGSITETATPNAEGILVFDGLPDGYYQLAQEDGVWCKAQAERVDSQSRVIVESGANTDVFFYQCNQDLTLPSTGSGDALSLRDGGSAPLYLALASIPLLGAAIWQAKRMPAMSPVRSRRPMTVEPEHEATVLSQRLQGKGHMRFR